MCEVVGWILDAEFTSTCAIAFTCTFVFRERLPDPAIVRYRPSCPSTRGALQHVQVSHTSLPTSCSCPPPKAWEYDYHSDFLNLDVLQSQALLTLRAMLDSAVSASKLITYIHVYALFQPQPESIIKALDRIKEWSKGALLINDNIGKGPGTKLI